ncbi:MAG: glycosyltransferase [Bryobacterales bacterium]|nr:galactosyldiacylglycerol synthase [Bryobacteraceae bacterium]MDW8130962.1 glycosyltransferase [Bryobacterales bacterium]
MRVDFVLFDAGGGHRAAATALELVIRQQRRPWEIRIWNLQDLLDSLDPARKLLGIRLQDLYNLLLKQNWTLGARYLLRVFHAFIRLYHAPMVRRLESHFRRERPDLVVSLIPHFNRALLEGLRRADPDIPYVTLLTDLADYPPHFWIERQAQYFICGSQRAAQQALELGHPQEAVFRVSGMVLHPRFYEETRLDRAEARRRLGLEAALPTGLLLFGGHGSRVMRRIVSDLDRSGLALQLVVICGHNRRLLDSIRRMRTRMPLLPVGFTDDVAGYMRLADFFIGKPGPGSISEALAMKLPVLVASNAWTLPHERYNAEWIREAGLGLVAPSYRRIPQAVARLLANGNLERFRARAAAIQNRAVFEVPDVLAEIARRGPAPPLAAPHRPPAGAHRPL